MKIKRTRILQIIAMGCFLLILASCSKSESTPPADPPPADPSKPYTALGFAFKGRLDSYTPTEQLTNPGYFITPLDVCLANDQLYVAWNIEEFRVAMPQGIYTTYYGTLSNGKFTSKGFSPCGDPSTNSDYDRVIKYQLDGQGQLFTSYRWRDNNSASLSWTQSYCCTSGVNSGGEVVDYPIDVEESNGLVTGMGGYIYNGLEQPFIKYYHMQGTSWQGDPMVGLESQIQGFNYLVTPGGNGFLAYTSLDQLELDGYMNLAGFDGVSWYNLGHIPLSKVRKVAGINIQTYYEPFKIQMVRNGEKPWILMFRNDNTMAVFRFDGTALQLVADQVPFTSGIDTRVSFCIYQDKLTTFGDPSNYNLLDNKQAIYQLEGDHFSLYKTVPITDLSLVGVWSNNTKLWIGTTIFSATNGFFYSPVDIIEL